VWWAGAAGALYLLLLVAPQVVRADPLDSYETTQRLPELHHAVGVPLPAEWPDPLGLPLAEGRKLECATCHGLKDIDRVPYARIDPKAEGFLRDGPYPDLHEFCFRCHDRADFERPNIHAMLDPAGKPKEVHCTYCHEDVQRERDEPLRRVDWKLRLPPEKLCFGCHLKTPHFNALEHQAAKPDAAMLAHLRDSRERLGVSLPLAADGRLMCPTCHNPHPEGLIDPARNPAGRSVHVPGSDLRIRYVEHPWSAVVRADKRERLEQLAAAGGGPADLDYRRIQREVLLRLPAKDGTLCQACHEFAE
jgi:hypothetical protein